MVVFKKVRWKNFLSTGNAFTEIDLTRSTNTLIIGQNGAGKSTILDALTFGLFGKPFRKINKPQLMNSINTNNCVVEVEFEIGKKHYKVVRGMKPNTFEIFCDSKLLNQDAKARDYQDFLEKNILKWNFKSFTQVVVLGSASFVPFMQLSAADRRNIIEDLLDIGIFSSMNTLVKDRLSLIRDEQKSVEYSMNLLAEKIKMQQQVLADNKKNVEEELSKKRQEIETNLEYIRKTTTDIQLIQKHVDILSRQVEDSPKVSGRKTKLMQIVAKMQNNYGKLKKEVEFYAENDNCPTCRQGISETHKQAQVEANQSKMSEIDTANATIDEEMAKLEKRLEEINVTQKKISDHNSEIIRLNAQVSAVNGYNTKLLQEIQEIESKKQSSTSADDRLKELKVQLKAEVKRATVLSEDKQYYEYAATLLKDTGIKTKIIKQYLPVMNKLINKYLTAMDFFVNFNLNENFEETIKSRHRDEFSYASFSEGEKMRIDLALLFTWRQIAKMKNSVSTNLLILDEVFDSSLDGVGTEEFMKLLNSLDKQTNVFVISHKGDQLFDRFRSVIKFEKRNNFSQVAK